MEVSSRVASRCCRFIYFFHWVPATWHSRAQTSIRAELPSEKLPTTWGRRRISRFSLSITLLVGMRVQCSLGKSQQVSGSSMPSSTFLSGFFQLHRAQFLHHGLGYLAGRFLALLGMDCLASRLPASLWSEASPRTYCGKSGHDTAGIWPLGTLLLRPPAYQGTCRRQ